ncbi:MULTISPECIES: NADH-quinone oxidoreductase subunit J [Nocardia]|uniref:NADH-quinone oxidoreductase subunit J n=1 Tax=Nocardia TaxID=1817 RepID=UPI000BF22116|nr:MULTISPECIES: NADH-quinone oxidoreductase subunit J [Nocardia]MBF6184300.1 NADH-quinone oxidoreductase subunit J [Nocardia farcinica]MBF6248352.1 NADH-quinone oxidoreductase subunit J [Nocardia elegans]MBF6406036.1 NADH-quinone oxidoreductase subunit J [Nocardia farcinica]PEH75642.1 NADH:ubiquinone oxidoreductase subunit J [Nocardia sp. FDAARGOS_372]
MTLVLAAEPLTRASTGEAVQFWILAPLAVLGALGMVFAAKAVHSAICLAATMIALAVMYIAQDALFLGVVQIVVYTGAVMMLFLFVLMLVGVDSAESLRETLRGQRIAATVVGIGFGLLLMAGIGIGIRESGVTFPATGFPGRDVIAELAELIFLRYVWAFELTGALLITATIGAMVLAHRDHFGARTTQRELSRRRFRDGASRATPLPTPGVYARHNAVDVPARLPDGSFEELSVSTILRHRRTRALTEAAALSVGSRGGQDGPESADEGGQR